MAIAALTFIYNESVNLPIWLRYYGRNFGSANLFIVDTESDDGSTEHLGDTNIIRIPRTKFDELEKTAFLMRLSHDLLNSYDAVVVTDCDELIVPDPAHFENLRTFTEHMAGDYATCVGLNLVHIRGLEPPFDPDKNVLSQRRHAWFASAACKTLVSRKPIHWLPGLHSCDMPPKIDGDLYLFHTKIMDFATAVARQMINLGTEWSEDSLARGFGAHHRYDIPRFTRAFFDVPDGLLARGVAPFDFNGDIRNVIRSSRKRGGFFRTPTNQVGSRLVEIPQRFVDAF